MCTGFATIGHFSLLLANYIHMYTYIAIVMYANKDAWSIEVYLATGTWGQKCGNMTKRRTLATHGVA